MHVLRKLNHLIETCYLKQQHERRAQNITLSQQPRQHNNPNFNSQNNREFRPRNNLSNVICHYCSKFGHLQKDCRLRQSHQINNQSNNRPNSNNNQGRVNTRYQNNNNYNRNNNNANNN